MRCHRYAQRGPDRAADGATNYQMMEWLRWWRMAAMADPKKQEPTIGEGSADGATSPAFDIDSPRESNAVPGRLQRGIEILEAQLKNLPTGPGVYRMLNAKGDPLYVVKAR